VILRIGDDSGKALAQEVDDLFDQVFNHGSYTVPLSSRGDALLAIRYDFRFRGCLQFPFGWLRWFAVSVVVFAQFLFQHLNGAADAQQGIAYGVGLGLKVCQLLLAAFEFGFEFLQSFFQLSSHFISHLQLGAIVILTITKILLSLDAMWSGSAISLH
jgi:hypothetical protein